MNRIEKAFSRGRESGEKLFLPYLCAGDPTPDLSQKLIRTAESAGADILELGIPYSDPLADGPTIQQAAQRSLEQGTRMEEVFNLVESVREESDVPLVLMTYYNPIFRYGEDRFLERVAEVGADGVLVVDLPPEEGLDFYDKAPEYGLETILLATPTTKPDRIEDLSELATGFLYYVLVTGVTGVRSGYNPELADKIRTAGERSELPTVVGFGVSDVDQIEDYLPLVDGVVSGSYLIEGINDNLGNSEAVVQAVDERVRSLADPLHAYQESAKTS
ncbi:MAG: tryptophan synthase subunit alpha [bacterium]